MNLSRIKELFEKPSVWLICVVVLVAIGGIMLVFGNDDWSNFGFGAICIGITGWFWTILYEEDDKPWCRRLLLIISAILFFPVMVHQLRQGPDGKPQTLIACFKDLAFGLISDIQHNLSEPPPLKASIETKSEFLGATDVLNLINLSEKGIVPTACKFHSSSEVQAITLPDVIKPYDSVKIELNKLHFRKGDRIVIECQGFSKPFVITGT